MWRPSLRRRPQAALRLCRDRVEWWVPGQAVFEHRGTCLIDCERSPDLPGLEAAIGSLLQTHRAALDGGSLHVVIDSAWLPVLAIDTRRELLSQAELEALLKHRLEHTYLDGSTGQQDWDIRFMHRPGDDLLIGFAVDPRLRRVLLEQLASHPIRVLSIQPAFTWAWDAGAPDRRKACKTSPGKSAWWLWEEHDRTLVALADQGHVRVLNVAAPQLAQTDARTLAKRETLRHGIRQAELPVLVSRWGECPVQAVPRRPSLDFLRRRRQPTMGWMLLLLGMVAIGGVLSWHQFRERIRSQEAAKVETRAMAQRKEREASLRPRVPTIEEVRLRRVQPELDQPWLPLMRAIESATEPPVFLLGLSMDPASGKLQIDAEAPDFDESMVYLRRLANVEFLRSAQIVSHDNTLDPWGRPSVKFTVVARWSGS